MSKGWENWLKGLQLEDWSEFTRWIYFSFKRQKFIEMLKILFLVFGVLEARLGVGALGGLISIWNEDSLGKEDVSSSQRVLAIKFI